MKKVLILGGVIFVAIVAVVFVSILYVYVTNRTVNQTVATHFTVSRDWIEIPVDPPLTAFRMIQELAIAFPDHRFDRQEDLPRGEIRLPNGAIAIPQIDGIDDKGNVVQFMHRGYSFSRRDFVTYQPVQDLGSNQLIKLRFRSNMPFECEEIIWLNRNPK